MPKTGRSVKSMRGVVVDFDLMDIASQLANSPKPAEVNAREDFVDKRLRRRQLAAERSRELAAKQKAATKQEEVDVAPEAVQEPAPKEEIRHLAPETPVVEEPAPVEEVVEEVAKPATKKTYSSKKKTTTKRTIKKKTSTEEE